MFVAKDGRIWDPDLDLAQELLGLIDRQLAALEDEWRGSSEADEFGVFDRMEHLTGLGFVACQTYMTSIYGTANISKAMALAQGPRHASGATVAAIVNHAANYWKHRDEWYLDRNEGAQARIRQAFDAVGFPVGTDYPLAGVLMEVATPHEPSFAGVLRQLVAWRDQLYPGPSQQ